MSFPDHQNNMTIKSSPKVQEICHISETLDFKIFQGACPHTPRGVAPLALGSRAFGTQLGGPRELWPRGPLAQSYAAVKVFIICIYILYITLL